MNEVCEQANDLKAPGIDYDALAQKIVEKQLNMHQDALWSANHVALYLCKSKSYVQQHVTVQPDFPAAVKVASNARCLVWRAGDVMNWALNKRRRKAG
jgi:hypothetical protein